MESSPKLDEESFLKAFTERIACAQQSRKQKNGTEAEDSLVVGGRPLTICICYSTQIIEGFAKILFDYRIWMIVKYRQMDLVNISRWTRNMLSQSWRSNTSRHYSSRL